MRVLDALVPQVHGHACGTLDLHPAAEFFHGDVRDAGCVRKALSGVSAVFHLAAEVGVGQSMYEIPRFIGANALGTATLLQEISHCRDQVRKLVVASSMTLYGEGSGRCPEHGIVEPPQRSAAQLERREWDSRCPHCATALLPAPTPETKRLAPTSVYAISKRDQEELCLTVGREYGIPTIALRYFNIYGPGQALSNPYTGIVAIFCARLLRGEPVTLYEDGRQSRDFVHVRDIVQANLLALEAGGSSYEPINISSGELWPVYAIARMIQDALGIETRLNVTGQYRSGDIRHCHADVTRAKQVLGYRPQVTLQDALPEIVQWARDTIPATVAAPQAHRELELHGLVR